MVAVARVSVMMQAVLPLIPWSGIRVVLRKVSWVGPGCRFVVVAFLVLILLPGLCVGILCKFTLFPWYLALAYGFWGHGQFGGFFLERLILFRALGWTTDCPVRR